MSQMEVWGAFKIVELQQSTMNRYTCLLLVVNSHTAHTFEY